METHQAAVDAISAQVRRFHKTQLPFRVYHGSTNSTRHAHFDRDAIVDVSGLNGIISIDRAARTAIVQPNVPMDALVRATTPLGLLPPVVMEFPGITVGGGFVGTAGESSSFKYGFFDRTVLSVEVVLADGEVVRASATQNQELFEGLRGSFGTLGVLTLVELRLLDVGSFVEVTYRPTSSFEHAMKALGEETRREDADYVDGILFAKDSGVVVTGRLTSASASSNIPIRRFSRPWDEWFWIHAKSLCAQQTTATTELVPIADYLFRYDRGAFWTGMYAFRHFMVPFTWFTRFLLDYFMHTRIMYHALHASGHTDRYIIQDIAFPGAAAAVSFVEWVDAELGLYPVWLCPLRGDARASMGHAQKLEARDQGEEEGYINVGVWGPYPSREEEYVRVNRALEKKTSDLGGLKWLYGRVFYSEDEWWGVYDKERYDALRRQFGATSLPSIWEKVRDRGRKRSGAQEGGLKGWIKGIVRGNGFLSGLYGVWKAIGGGDYLLGKKRKTG